MSRKVVKSQILIGDNDIIKVISMIYKDKSNLKVEKRKGDLCILYKNNLVAKFKLNEYDSIIDLKLQRRYGYLNTHILSKFLGLIYRKEIDNGI